MEYTSLTLPEFIKRFSTEEACLQAIFDAKWPRGFVCPHCQHNDGYRLSKRRSIECSCCGKQTSILSGTMFERTHVPLVNWFLIIYFVAQDKGGSSALKLSNQLGMRNATVHELLKKLRFAMSERDGNLTLAGFIEMDEAFFGGRNKSKKPGKSPSDGKVHVLVLVENEGERAGNVVMKVLNEDSWDELRSVVSTKVDDETSGQRFIADGKQFHSAVRSLGHSIEFRPFPKCELDAKLPCVSLLISHAKRFFKGTYHHFCKQNIQFYLNEFCYRFNRRHQWCQIASRLIAAATLCVPMQPA
jgi:ISXO2-like transposase domain/Transposase zinc-ribbon domain